MINPILILLWSLMETGLHLLFYLLIKWELKPDKSDISLLNRKGVLMGILERLFLIIGLLNGYPEVITAFAALKIASRIKKKEPSDYFLMGNILSLLGALGMVIVYQKIIG